MDCFSKSEEYGIIRILGKLRCQRVCQLGAGALAIPMLRGRCHIVVKGGRRPSGSINSTNNGHLVVTVVFLCPSIQRGAGPPAPRWRPVTRATWKIGEKLLTDSHFFSWLKTLARARKPNWPLHLRAKSWSPDGREKTTCRGRRFTAGHTNTKCARWLRPVGAV
jgi:hypothetical protein